MDWTAPCNRPYRKSVGEREVEAMIDHVVGNKVIPARFRQDIIERTDGIPLFVEEMAKAVLEAESEGNSATNAAAVPSRHWRSPQVCTPRSWRGLIGLVRPRRSRKSERR